MEEIRLKSLLTGSGDDKTDVRMLEVNRILELAQRAHFLYLTRKPAEQAELLKKVLLNCSIDAVSPFSDAMYIARLIFCLTRSPVLWDKGPRFQTV